VSGSAARKWRFCPVANESVPLSSVPLAQQWTTDTSSIDYRRAAYERRFRGGMGAHVPPINGVRDVNGIVSQS